MTEHAPRNLPVPVVVGAVMILIGLVVLVDKLNVSAPLRLLEFWPVLLMGGGMSLVLEHFDDRPRT